VKKVAIVTTCIYDGPPVYADWARVGDLIVAGDLNTPPALISYLSDIGALYLTPERQREENAWSEHVGWQNIQRRNAAIWYAYASDEYDYILTVDDDNYPQPDAERYVERHIANMSFEYGQAGTLIGGRNGYFNTGSLCVPAFWQRGTPYGINVEPWAYTVDAMPEIVVSQSQILGDPDCDAIDRMCYTPNVLSVATDAIISPGTYAAFNTQGTMWKRNWAPVMAVLPGIGRYDDIFSSFMFARMGLTYNTTFAVGEPVMKQDRNEHNLVKDLRAEVWGLRNTFEFCDRLSKAQLDSGWPLWKSYSELVFAVRDVLPRSTMYFLEQWTNDWRAIFEKENQ
jgi:glycosyltransferase involved in cell wall biosynthesis